jgi:hypothetical protein
LFFFKESAPFNLYSRKWHEIINNNGLLQTKINQKIVLFRKCIMTLQSGDLTVKLRTSLQKIFFENVYELKYMYTIRCPGSVV